MENARWVKASTNLVLLLHNTEQLNGEIFTTLREAQVLIENWRRHYNAIRRTHPSAIGRQKYPFVRFIDLERIACPEGGCPAHESYHVFYFDAGHMTVRGALRLLPALRAPGMILARGCKERQR